MEHLQPRATGTESDPEDEEVRAARNAERKRKHEEEIEKIKRMKMEDLATRGKIRVASKRTYGTATPSVAGGRQGR